MKLDEHERRTLENTCELFQMIEETDDVSAESVKLACHALRDAVQKILQPEKEQQDGDYNMDSRSSSSSDSST